MMMLVSQILVFFNENLCTVLNTQIIQTYYYLFSLFFDYILAVRDVKGSKYNMKCEYPSDTFFCDSHNLEGKLRDLRIFYLSLAIISKKKGIRA